MSSESKTVPTSDQQSSAVAAGLPQGPGREPLWTSSFIFLSLSNLSLFIAFQMLLPTLPVYVQQLGGTEAMAGLVIGVFTVSAVLIRPLAGLMADIYGRQLPFFLGLGIFALSVFGYNWVPTVALLLALRFLHGLGWGLAGTSAGTVAADIVPKNRLSEGMGYFGLASTLAMAIAPAIGLWVIKTLGFSLLFYSSTGLTLLALALAMLIKYRKNLPPATRPGLLEPSAFGPSLVIFLVTMTYGAIVSFIALDAGQKGISNIGIFFTIYALTVALVRPVAGVWADRFGSDVAIVPGLILVGAAMLVLSQAKSLSTFLVAAGMYGLGFGAVQPSLQALVVRDLPPQRRGTANGTFYTAFDLGIGVGSTLWGALAQGTGYDLMYLIAALPGFLALPAYLFLRRASGKK